jgi:hypothetical protein
MSKIVIRDINTNEIVREMDVSSKTPKQIEKIEMGLMRQIDAERFVFGEE